MARTSLAAKGRDAISLNEHRAIVDAIEMRDEIAAEQSLRHHISMAFETRLKEDAHLGGEDQI
jgi:DNA-binding FadR family transcriptional regulator